MKVSDSLQTEFFDVVKPAVGGHFEGRTYMMNKNTVGNNNNNNSFDT
jgi:hypothetical protein